MRTATETRNAAFHDHRDSGRLGDQQQAVMRAFHRPGAAPDYSSKELAGLLGMERSSVTGRLNELVALGFLEWGYVRPCRITARRITPARLPGRQLEIFQ